MHQLRHRNVLMRKDGEIIECAMVSESPTGSVNDEITTDGRWNVLVVDDLFDSGASMDAACAVLREYPKVGRIYVAALTWK